MQPNFHPAPPYHPPAPAFHPPPPVYHPPPPPIPASERCYVPDYDIWLPDGNVVLVASLRGYRVHASMLSRHSPALHNVLNHGHTAPQAPISFRPLGRGGAPPPPVDGCVHLSLRNTAAYDVKQLLSAIYGGLQNLVGTDEPPSFAVVAAWARMGHTYEVKELAELAAACMDHFFPTSLADWDAIRTPARGEVRFAPDDAIEALNVVRVLKRADWFPAAVYRCALLDTNTLVKGTTRADRVTLERLSADDLVVCIEVGRRMREAGAQMAVRLFAVKMGTCCWRVLDAKKYEVCAALEEYVGGDPLDGRARGWLEAARAAGACENCVEELEEEHEKMRKALWAELPEIMGVGEEVAPYWGAVCESDSDSDADDDDGESEEDEDEDDA